MIKNVAHLADVHISNNIKRHDEYRIQFQKIYNKLKEMKPDRIVISGDITHDKLQANNECKELVGEFLTELSKISKVVLTLGNHDFNFKNKSRIPTPSVIIKLLNNKNIKYLTKSGFYEDDNVVWVNHSHLEKNVNPWDDIEYTKDKDKIYIDLFHDPVNGCISDTGFKMEKRTYKTVKDFKGDFAMLGDIHKYQFLDSKKTKAYCGSTIQQNFGESPDNHGFIFWDISNGDSEMIDITNEQTLITFNVTEGFDYNNIKFDDPLATHKSQFRIIWEDLSPNINLENEEKIKKYIRDKWNDNPIKWKKIRIFQNIASSKKISESLNVNDPKIQQDIFREYLEMNKYDKNFIEEILEIDDIITSRLEINNSVNNIEWNIDKFWFENFKSYEEEDVEWSHMNNSIIQINGKNQIGKSTLLDAICYIGYGTTLATHKLGGAKREKNGDNRYINNKRTLDYCLGGAILDINGEKYTISRKTKREWTKKKTVKSASTIVDYWRGTEMTEENKETDENRIKTQKLIEEVLGDFEDFVRMSLTNADNLNSLISLDRATFIDSIIKDAGYDIFEKKLNEFKDYKKEVEKDKININLDDANVELDGLKELIKTLNIDKEDISKAIKEVTSKIDIVNKERDIEIKKLNKIDKDIANINVEDVNNKLEQYKKAIDNNISVQKSNNIKAKDLKQSYDKEELEKLYSTTKKIEDDILNNKLKISQLENVISDNNNTIEKVDDKIIVLKEKEISNLKSDITDKEREIKTLEKDFTNIVNEQIRNINSEITEKQYEIKNIETKLSNIKEKGIDIKKRISELENSKVCSECGREHEEDTLVHIRGKIDGLNVDIANLMVDVKKLQSDKKILEEDIDKLKDVISEIKDGNYNKELLQKQTEMNNSIDEINKSIDNINNIITEIENDDFTNATSLLENINKGLDIKKKSEEKIIETKSDIVNINNLIKEGIENKSKYSDDILVLEKEKEEVKSYEILMQENKELSLKIENIKLTIENAKTKIDRYYEQLKYIEENIEIDANIALLDNKISELKSEHEDENDRLNESIQEITLTNNTITDIENRINIFKEQVKKEELLKVYMSCVHRDGVPKMLILKSKELINKEISDLLCDCDFDVFFDDELNLKLVADVSPGVEQNLLESSGKERSFGAISLKLALRKINHKSKPNFMFLDEIYGKLDEESVNDFNELLMNAKKDIDKILIIEHHANINYDYLFNISKNSKGISSLSIE